MKWKGQFQSWSKNNKQIVNIPKIRLLSFNSSNMLKHTHLPSIKSKNCQIRSYKHIFIKSKSTCYYFNKHIAEMIFHFNCRLHTYIIDRIFTCSTLKSLQLSLRFKNSFIMFFVSRKFYRRLVMHPDASGTPLVFKRKKHKNKSSGRL